MVSLLRRIPISIHMGVAPAYNPDDVKSGETFSCAMLPPNVGKVTYRRERQGPRSIYLGSKTAPRVITDSTDKVSGIVSSD